MRHGQQFQHAWRAAGTYRVSVGLLTYGCQAEPPVAQVGLETTIVVVGAAATTNGSLAPRAELRREEYTDGVRLGLAGSDADGWVTRMVLDWGDGSSPVVLTGGQEPCDDAPTRWPVSHWGETLGHRYPAPGPHTVRLTVTSTGCDGGTPQTATTVLQWDGT